MNDEDRDDAELSDAQRAAVARLTSEEVAAIDSALLAHVPDRWRKVAYVIGLTMQSFGDRRAQGIPDVYYAERVRALVDRGLIDSVGNLRRMGSSEVRRRPQLDPKDSLH